MHPAHQWYLTPPRLCPYLPGRAERRIFTRLGEDASRFHAAFTQAGFRRNGDIFYRPFCPDCSACVSVRIRAHEFVAGRWARRILRRNRDIRALRRPPTPSTEQYALLRAYLLARHRGSEMMGLTEDDYAAMVADAQSQTRLFEYRREADDALLAVSLSDRLADGFSMTYSFFDPRESSRGLGNFMILDHVYRASLPPRSPNITPREDGECFGASVQTGTAKKGGWAGKMMGGCGGASPPHAKPSVREGVPMETKHTPSPQRKGWVGGQKHGGAWGGLPPKTKETPPAQRSSYVYLGYWIRDARAMSYKTRFRPLEYLSPTGWQPLEEESAKSCCAQSPE